MGDLFGRDHDWITVLGRRWCIGCSAFQSGGPAWRPNIPAVCPRDTPAAIEIDRLPQEMPVSADEPAKPFERDDGDERSHD